MGSVRGHRPRLRHRPGPRGRGRVTPTESAAATSTTISLELSTPLSALAPVVWTHATTPAGINAEFQPWMRMTVPRRLRHTSLDEVELGVRVCRSWVLVLGVIPFEYDDLVIVERGPGLRFLERSSTLVARTWQHERTVVSTDHGCRLTDRVSLEPRAAVGRLPGSAVMVRRVVEAIFDHRHRRLAARFG